MPSQSRAQSRSLSRESRGKSRLIAERFPWIRQETRRRYQSIVQRTRTWQESLFKSNNAPFFPPLPLARARDGLKEKGAKPAPKNLPIDQSCIRQRRTMDDVVPCGGCVSGAIKLVAFTTTRSNEQRRIRCRSTSLVV